MNNQLHSYHFDLKKDHGWLWLITLPFGIICWLIPFVLAIGLTKTGLEQGTAAVIAFLFLGIPAFLIGWIFIYSFMEMLITRISFSDNTIEHRKPLLLFPLIWRTKKITKSEIKNIDFFARNGTRAAILLFLKQGNRIRKYFLPLFKNQPDYLNEFKAFSELANNNPINEKSNVEMPEKEQMLADTTARRSNLRAWDAFLKFFSGLLIFVLMIGCGLYCLQLPGPAFQLFSAGASVGMVLVIICLIISIPVLGQGLIWFFGRTLIIWSFGFLKIESNSLFVPVTLQHFFLQWFKLETSRLSLTDFSFWCFFMLSILYSIDRLVRRLFQRR